MPVAQESNLRFAVGTFDSWSQLREALRDAHARALVLDSFNCLALRKAFKGKTIVAPSRERVGVEALPFFNGPGEIACTSGPLADHLAEKLRSGARSLREALEHSLFPRHVAHLVDAVRTGKIVFWIRVTNAHDELRAYQTLLANSSDSVGVHDLVPGGQ
jgi:hypothetical protein